MYLFIDLYTKGFSNCKMWVAQAKHNFRSFGSLFIPLPLKWAQYVSSVVIQI